jgi:hypothetical protein
MRAEYINAQRGMHCMNRTTGAPAALQMQRVNARDEEGATHDVDAQKASCEAESATPPADMTPMSLVVLSDFRCTEYRGPS